jgi:hypothetical protein
MKKFWTLVALLFVTALAGYGQATSVNGGSIQGSITDPSGAVVPGASVTITDTDTASVKTVITDSAGFYSVGPLIPGNYTVSITKTGFEKLSVKTVVRTGTATNGSFKVTLGASTETVEVNAGALQINTEQIGVSGVVTREQIDSLPVNGRNILDYAQLQPGVVLQPGMSFDPTKAGYSAISTSGVGGRTTRILLDGQDITDETVGTTIFNVPSGAIQEFQLNRSTQDVSGEVTSTGQVLVSTQSGTNAYHGNAFYNFQDARAGAAEVGGIQAPFQRNQFGGYFGGPIIKDKLFFFGGLERIKQSEEDVALGASPIFQSILNQYALVPAPFNDTFSMARLDYNGPKGIHFFVRAAYSVNSDFSTDGADPYSVYQNRDNVPGIVGGADFTTGHFTHSFRGGYEKFHNLLQDGTAALGNSIYNPSTGPDNQITLVGSISAGPNDLAPQGTFQTDKQFRYDGTWSKGAHTFKFGYDMNRLASGGFAEFFGASLVTVLNATPGNLAGPDATNPLDYVASEYLIGNGNSLFSERPGFGLPGGLSPSWRFGAYVADTWKASQSLTLTGGLRWSVDTDRANQDLATPLCSSVDPSLQFAGCTGNTPLFDQYQAGLGVRTHQPYANFGPQAGFNFSPGDHKTSLRGGIGIFYESSVFNNTGNTRTESVQADFPSFNNGAAFAGGSNIILPGVSPVTQAPDGTPVSTILNEPISQAAPEINAIKAAYQAKVQNVAGPNPSYIGTGNALDASNIYAGPYKSPYSIQFNGGIQREIARGLILSADYVHNATLKIPISQDVNHTGAARTLNTPAAQNAIAVTLAACGAPSINAAIAPGGCPGLHPATATSPAGSAVIQDFAAAQFDANGNPLSGGLDSANYSLGSTPASANGFTIATGAAFPGTNPNVGRGLFILPVGRSGYDALQVVLQQQKSHPVPGIMSSNFQISYSLSRIVSGGAAANPGDQFFAGAPPFDNDDPNRYLGRTPLDHTNELSFGGSLGVKYGLNVAMIGHFFSAPAASLTLDTSSGNTAQIFQTDVDGDGTIGDLIPGTIPGAYEHQVKGAGLNKLINNYNAANAYQPTPAGNALVAAGLFTPGQLLALNAVQQPIASAPNNPLNNAALRTFDLSANYPIKFNRFREGLSIVPGIAVYNVFNMSNFGSIPGIVGSGVGTLLNAADAGQQGYYNGTNDQATLNQARTVRNSGTFDQGGPRTTEFQLKVNF